MQDISSRMDAVCRRFEELSIRLNQPDTAADPAQFRKLMREYHDTEPVVEAYRDWQTALDHLAQAKALLEAVSYTHLHQQRLLSGYRLRCTAAGDHARSCCEVRFHQLPPRSPHGAAGGGVLHPLG